MKIKIVRILTNMYTILLVLFSSACDNENNSFYPKPLGYNHIKMPKHEYQGLEDDKLPYYFEYSKYANIYDDTVGLSEAYWKKIFYSKWSSEIDITYKNVRDSKERLDSLIRDAHKLVSKHYSKMEEQPRIVDSTFLNGKKARLFYLSGEVPTTFQFFTSDSVKNFLRCSLYFPTAQKNDSLKPIIDFCIQDMYHMINTLKWRNLEPR